jgi:hypothetical protein
MYHLVLLVYRDIRKGGNLSNLDFHGLNRQRLKPAVPEMMAAI